MIDPGCFYHSLEVLIVCMWARIVLFAKSESWGCNFNLGSLQNVNNEMLRLMSQ